MRDIVCVILAAGQGKRIQQGEKTRQKVLLKLRQKPMLGHVLETVASVGIERVIVVTGHQSEEVKQYLRQWRKRLHIETVRQKLPRGTADAVRQAESLLARHRGDVLVLYGDTPLLTERTLRMLLERHRAQKNTCTLLTTMLEDPTGYGRIVRNGQSEAVSRIVEEADAGADEKAVKEINVGVYCFQSRPLFDAIKEVKPDNRKNEYYLTDTITILAGKRKMVRSVVSRDRYEVLGVNSPSDLTKVRRAFSKTSSHS